MLQRLGIRGKLLAVVAVPILVLIVAAGVITLGSVQDLNAARNAEELIDTLDRARDLQADLQTERALAANFVHAVQNGESNLRTAYETTSSALDDLAVRLAEPDIENPEEIQAAIDAALSRSGNQILAVERTASTSPPTEESEGWLVFPAEDEITAMQEAYAAVVADIDAIIADLPDDNNLNVALGALSFRVNNESVIATELFTAPLQYREPMAAAKASVDSGVQSLQGSAQSLSQSEENDRAVASLLAGQEAIAQLEGLRANVRAVSTGAASVTTFYSDIIATIVNSADDVAVAMADRGLVSVVQAYGDLDALIENIKYEEVVIERLIRAGVFLPGEAGQVRTFTTQTDLSMIDAQNSVAGVGRFPEVPPFGASESDTVADTNSFSSVRTQVLSGLDSALFTARLGQWNTQVAEELAVYEPLREEIWATVQAEAATTAQNALVQTVITAIAVAAVVIISIVVALIIARTIIGPLRRLTTTATAVRQELPRLVARVAIPGETVDVSEVQIPVESRDEIGRLAEAFNGVNAATLDIAGEQSALRGSISEMFVNVARRDQVLLNRQLASIDEMERTEDNPETLTKLFALDHLATRMRRNSESLLVLAGIDTGRRLRRPMPLSDVIRTASSEIELYERVQLELDIDPQMLGHSALTTAHLIAELLENATVFSDPGTSVVVRTAQHEDSYIVEVKDSGIGMTPKELDDANGRINSTSASEILGAQRLGLFVVGRIARRVGATVTIDSEEGKGTTATVSLPRSVFASGDATPAVRVPVGTVDEATHAPIALTRHNVADEVADAPARAPMGVDAYTPTAIEGGTSLTGRSGPEEPAAAQRSIEDLIASDAASAPAAEPADPAALTDGSSPAGLPSRRRRDTSQTADAGSDRSVVGLPARATDAQLSALAAESAGGFTPAVPASEITPQTAEERSSMFRGFRARRGNEDEASVADSAPQVADQDDNQGVAVDAEASSALPVRTPSPTAPPAPVQPSEPASPRDAGMAAAGAAGAAAFFARRARDEASGVVTPPIEHTPPVASPPEMAVPQLSEDEPAGEHAAVPELSAFEPSASAPSVSEPSGFAPSAQEVSEPSAPALPVFRMPKLESDPDPVGQQHGSATEPSFEPQPFAVPGFADEPAAPQHADSPAYSASADPEAAPYGGVDQVSLEGDDATYGHAAAPGFLNASPYEQPLQQHEQQQEYQDPQQYGQVEQQQYGEAQQPYEQPQQQFEQAEQSYEQPEAYPSPQQQDEQPEQQYEQPAALAESPSPWAPATEPSAPAPSAAAEPQYAPSASSGHAERANANLDALLQTAADNDTEERPGFFSRLFGRGRNADPDTAGAAATKWADVSDQSNAPASASATTMSFAPVVDPAPVAASAPVATPRESLFAPSSAPEPVQQPVSDSAPATAASAAPWETGAQSFAPVPAAEPSAAPAPAWHSAPTAPESQPESFPWEQAQPAQPTQPQAFSPTPIQEPAGPQGTYTPDQLADATGWEAAGASALRAAQPDVATSYQPVIQPEEGGADLASAVFSEFSSLAAERPKVEKTRAGLERRRPSDAKPVEVTPIEATPDIVPAKRDADAIRSRFTSFYSGTQRARDDVAVFDSRSHSTEASDK